MKSAFYNAYLAVNQHQKIIVTRIDFFFVILSGIYQQVDISMNNINDFKIVPAKKGEEGLILSFIKKLAEYEKLSHAVIADEEIIKESFFGSKPAAECVIAYYKEEPVGFAIYFYNFSSFIGRAGLYLEDLFVLPEMRGKGFGKKILKYLAKLAVEKKCGRFEWAVLDWNEPSRQFYKNLGAIHLEDWQIFRLSGEPLKNLAK